MPDGNIGVFVFIGKAEAHKIACGRAQPARALDVHEKQFHRVVGVAQDGRASVERACVDLGAGEIGDKLVADKPSFERGGARSDGELGEVGNVCAVALDGTAVVACGGNAHAGFAVA